jgi:hypothetical protein
MMYLALTFSTSDEQYPDLKNVWNSNVVHKDFSAAAENQKPDLASTDSSKVLDEEKNIAGTLALLELAKWAQEQQFEWEGSPNVGVNHDVYFIEAVKAALEADDDDDDVLEVERQASE